jgi:hypothetical protein
VTVWGIGEEGGFSTQLPRDAELQTTQVSRPKVWISPSSAAVARCRILLHSQRLQADSFPLRLSTNSRAAVFLGAENLPCA